MKYIDTDKIIERLLNTHKITLPNGFVVQEYEIQYLVSKSEPLFLSDSMLLEITPPVSILGDIHGQLSDLLRYFEMEGYPPEKKYLFLGNYVNRGEHSIETMCLLMAYKIKYPQSVFLLRGNHETKSLSSVYGFYDHCKRLSGAWIWSKFLRLFNSLPVAAVVDNSIFCVHGGLSPQLESLDQIRQLPRLTEVPSAGLLCDLLWSDPSPYVDDWGISERGISYSFGNRAVDTFLSRFNFDILVRGSDVVNGFYFYSERLVSLFSAPNYCEEGNSGAMLSISPQGYFNFRVISASEISTTGEL